MEGADRSEADAAIGWGAVHWGVGLWSGWRRGSGGAVGIGCTEEHFECCLEPRSWVECHVDCLLHVMEFCKAPSPLLLKLTFEGSLVSAAAATMVDRKRQLSP